MEIFSPGKINLTLDVGPVREDGYHEVSTVMQTFDFGDVLCFHKRGFSFELNCTQAPAKDLFLIRQAYDRFCEEVGEMPGVRIRLEKHLPMLSGLGGGSSNAAKVLLGMNGLYDYNLSRGTLNKMAADLGSDVPFFLGGRRSLATGRGTDITPLPVEGEAYLLLINDGTRLKSSDVYAKMDTLEEQKPNTPDFLKALEEGRDIVPYLGNHMEQAAFLMAPQLKEIRDQLLEAGAEAAHLCGSGGTLYGYFRDRNRASKAKDAFRGVFSRVVHC